MIQQQLENIQKWLVQHASKIADQSLNPSASISEIEQFEQKLSKRLPEAFKDLYSWHNGMNEAENLGNLFYGMELFSLDRILQYRANLADLANAGLSLEHTDPQINPDNAHNPEWIIFAHDGGRTGLYLDLAPTSQGKVGQIIFVDVDFDVAILVADSIEALVNDFASDLMAGLYELNEDALEDENEFLECDGSIDLVNWHNSQRWARPLFK
ncbi:SMI1/KNR4 family protein [Acinetobacter sp. WCHAc060033]|uniref:SMI1/KNR4 family protein n=1 Tax=Acinetobacter sp. WCHAc060033 TaxID=2518624 RepID=UPI001022DC1D|nr:SMI1/KNR4 family protein [Acinetobacter sp. WCHAc060033]RZG82730.1 SMI1/KNR4 family protein [Acinetobacter sp. WCHAc060033]